MRVTNASSRTSASGWGPIDLSYDLYVNKRSVVEAELDDLEALDGRLIQNWFSNLPDETVGDPADGQDLYWFIGSVIVTINLERDITQAVREVSAGIVAVEGTWAEAAESFRVIVDQFIELARSLGASLWDPQCDEDLVRSGRDVALAEYSGFTERVANLQAEPDTLS